MKNKFGPTIFLLLALLGRSPNLLAGTPPEDSPQHLFENSLNQSQNGNYSSALIYLKKAKSLFSKKGNLEGTYRCNALEYYLTDQNQTVTSGGQNPPPAYFRLGWLLKDFNYSGTYIIPPIPSKSFQGILLFTKKVRDISQGPGRSTPAWGVLDVQTIPHLNPGEEISGGLCELKGKAPDPGIAAIVMTKGHQNEEKFHEIRKAWLLNPGTGKIEELPNGQVTCINEGLGV